MPAATRRGFMLGSSALLASLLMPRAVTSPQPDAADPSSFDDAAYWAFADRMQDQLDRYWDGEHLHAQARDAEREPAAHARRGGAGGPHRPGAPRRPRARAGARAVQRAGVGRRRPRTGSQGHKPGWQDGISGDSGIQHLVVDTEIAWPLMFAWQAREALGHRPGHRGPDRRPHHLDRQRRVLAVADAAAEPDQLVHADVRRRRDRRRRPRRTCTRSCCSRCAASSTARASR